MTKFKDEVKLQSWQIFAAARRHLGPSVVSAIFGKRRARMAYLWAQDPAVTDSHHGRDPLESIKMMFERMAEVGRGDVVRSALGYLAGALDDSTEIDPVVDCLPTMDAELLADFGAVALLREGIEEDFEPEEVERLAQAAIDEVGRSLAKYKAEIKKRS